MLGTVVLPTIIILLVEDVAPPTPSIWFLYWSGEPKAL